jgi:hypothetical protein
MPHASTPDTKPTEGLGMIVDFDVLAAYISVTLFIWEVGGFHFRFKATQTTNNYHKNGKY